MQGTPGGDSSSIESELRSQRTIPRLGISVDQEVTKKARKRTCTWYSWPPNGDAGRSHHHRRASVRFGVIASANLEPLGLSESPSSDASGESVLSRSSDERSIAQNGRLLAGLFPLLFPSTCMLRLVHLASECACWRTQRSFQPRTCEPHAFRTLAASVDMHAPTQHPCWRWFARLNFSESNITQVHEQKCSQRRPLSFR